MRNSSNLLRFFRSKRGLFGITFLLAVLAFLLSMTTMSHYHSQSSYFSVNTFTTYLHGNLGVSAGSKVDEVMKKIVRELGFLKELTADSENDQSELMLERLRFTRFLNDILGEIVFVKESLSQSGGFANQQQTGAVGAHPMSNNNESYDDFIEYFLVEEIRKYVRIKPSRLGKQNFMGANGTFASIGHACFSMKEQLEEYMDYDVGDFCNDDWNQAQKLMVHGCDPLPRRRCFTRGPKFYGPKFYTKPLPISESIWNLPDDHNVRWSHYKCKNFKCLAKNSTGKGFFKCSDCFNLTHHEMPRWKEVVYIEPSSNLTSDFLIEEVLQIKPREIRIGLDFSVGTGTFAARMREFNVTIASATINLGAPFNEMIALRGLLPLYVTINQRLPFFDNTLDVIHTTRFLDGWIDFILLDFVLYDWDRVLRPGGLLWIDSFFCSSKDLDDYLEAFKMLRYKEHRWIVVPKIDKDGEEVFFSAVLEKPLRPF